VADDEPIDWSITLAPCGDRSCLFRPANDRGMHSNGGCQHLKLGVAELRRLLMLTAAEVKRHRGEKFFVIRMGSGSWYQEPMPGNTGVGYTLRPNMIDATIFGDRKTADAAADRLRRGGNLGVVVKAVSYSVD